MNYLQYFKSKLSAVYGIPADKTDAEVQQAIVEADAKATPNQTEPPAAAVDYQSQIDGLTEKLNRLQTQVDNMAGKPQGSASDAHKHIGSAEKKPMPYWLNNPANAHLKAIWEKENG